MCIYTFEIKIQTIFSLISNGIVSNKLVKIRQHLTHFMHTVI